MKATLPAHRVGMDLCFGQAVNVWLKTAVLPTALLYRSHGAIKACHLSTRAGYQMTQTAETTWNIACISGPDMISIGTIYRATRECAHCVSTILNMWKRMFS